MAQSWVTKTEFLDKSMQIIPADSISSHAFYIERISKTLNNRGKADLKYILHKGSKSIQLKEVYFKALTSKEVDLEKAFDHINEEYGHAEKIEIKQSKWFMFRNIAIVLGIILFIATFVSFALLTEEKNFDGKVIEVTDENIDSLKIGNYVKSDVYILDAYNIEITTTRSRYGIETGTDVSEGNTYLLGTFNDDQSLKTFIYRFGPGSDTAKNFKALAADEYVMTQLTGEVKDFSVIEKLDSGDQVVEYFQKSLAEYYSDVAFNQPAILIDGRVTQANKNDVLAIVGIIAAATVLTIIFAIISNRKNKSIIQDFVRKADGGSSSPIMKNN